MRLNFALAVGLVVAFAASLLAGRVWISPWHPPVAGTWLIIMELRLPRACLALAVGAALGSSGAAMQGYLRNPLADAGLFGIAPCAALGAVLALEFGAWSGTMLPAYVVPACALAGAATGMLLLVAVAGQCGGAVLFALAGMMISSMAGALMSLAISLAPSPFALSQIVSWSLGALADRSWHEVWIAAPLAAVGLGCFVLARRGLDAMSLGDEAARSLGVDPQRLRLLLVAGVGCAVGGSVATTGVVGFVGLVVPHMLRPFTNRRPAALIVPSALGGALFVLLADSLCRLVPLAGGELRLGIVLSLLGGPFFIALMLRLRGGTGGQGMAGQGMAGWC
jgi:iron complex transport system permease protein